MGSAVFLSFSVVVHSNKFTFTHSSIGPTHAPLDATLGSRSGDCQWKRKFHYSHTSFCSFPAQFKWFSCVPRDTYKTVCCWSLVNMMPTMEPKLRKLHEVLRQLQVVKVTLQNTDIMLNTPPQNIEDCCYLSALTCFKDNLQKHFNSTEKKRSILIKSLGNTNTVRGLDFCNSGNNSTCQSCDSHPKENAKEFFNRLESLIQRAITRWNMN